MQTLHLPALLQGPIFPASAAAADQDYSGYLDYSAGSCWDFAAALFADLVALFAGQVSVVVVAGLSGVDFFVAAGLRHPVDAVAFAGLSAAVAGDGASYQLFPGS